jgi:hypothetical protein
MKRCLFVWNAMRWRRGMGMRWNSFCFIKVHFLNGRSFVQNASKEFVSYNPIISKPRNRSWNLSKFILEWYMVFGAILILIMVAVPYGFADFYLLMFLDKLISIDSYIQFMGITTSNMIHDTVTSSHEQKNLSEYLRTQWYSLNKFLIGSDNFNNLHVQLNPKDLKDLNYMNRIQLVSKNQIRYYIQYKLPYTVLNDKKEVVSEKDIVVAIHAKAFISTIFRIRDPISPVIFLVYLLKENEDSSHSRMILYFDKKNYNMFLGDACPPYFVTNGQAYYASEEDSTILVDADEQVQKKYREFLNLYKSMSPLK